MSMLTRREDGDGAISISLLLYFLPLMGFGFWDWQRPGNRCLARGDVGDEVRL